MKSNKYYIPNIEEFHQGFEYEVWYNSAYTKEKWIKETFEFYDKDQIYHYDCVDLIPSFKNNGDSIRVKYLDQEDIESLGFIKHKTIDNYWKLNNIVLRIKNFKISIYVYDDYTVDKLIFEGIIKNKSELIKLLKQLNINEIK